MPRISDRLSLVAVVVTAMLLQLVCLPHDALSSSSRSRKWSLPEIEEPDMTPYYVALGAIVVITGLIFLARSHGHSIPEDVPQPPDSTLAPGDEGQEGDSPGSDESALSRDSLFLLGNTLPGRDHTSHAIPINVFMDLRQYGLPLGTCAGEPHSRNLIAVIGLSFAF